jgi:phospholipid/cholesterol/gamma-HCH transport system substrate-binding protein
MNARLRRWTAGLGALATVLALSGCSLLTKGVYNTARPGGASVGSHPLKLSADFSNALDLVPQSSVKVDDVAVGRVTSITLSKDEKSAHVSFLVNGSVHLPVGTTARIETTSLLGEKYVALQRPTSPTSGQMLVSGDNLGQALTSQAAEVEQVLGALSMVLNGGDIGQFQEISRELQKISTGRTGQIRSALRQIDGFVSVLNSRRGAITSALDGLDGLSKTLDGQRDQIATALDGLSPGLKVLSDQRPQLVAMLSALNRLSTVTVRTLNHSQRDIVTDLKTLNPILTQLARSGADLPNALQILLTYPFPDSVLGAIKGDYLNVFVLTNFRTLPAGCAAIGCTWPQASPRVIYSGSGTRGPAAPLLLPPTSSAKPGSPSPTLLLPTATASGTAATPSLGSPSGEPSRSSAATPAPSQSPSAPAPSDTGTPATATGGR